MKGISQPFTAYITDKERLVEIEKALAEVKDIWELCGVMTDIYEKELVGLDDRNTIIASRYFITSIFPLLQNYKGSISVKSIRGGIYKYVIHKEVNLKKIQESKTLMAYVTSEERKEKIKKALAKVTNYKELCHGVIGDIYNNELADKSDRDKIIISLPFVRSIVPYVKNLEGSRICNVRNIRKGIDHYLFGKKRDKGKKTANIDKKVYSAGKNLQRPIAKPLMDYITDENRKKEIVLALSKVEDAKMLCLKVINDVYTTELAGMEERKGIVVSKRFIESLFPYMSNFRGKLIERYIYAAIRKYVLLWTKENNKRRVFPNYLHDEGLRKEKEESIHKRRGYLPLMDYITDERRKEYITIALSNVKDLRALCRKVILDVYEKELADYGDRRNIVVSKPFIESIFPLLKNFKGVCSCSNFSGAIFRYVLFWNEGKPWR